MNNRLIITLSLFFAFYQNLMAQKQNLEVYYFEHAPFTYHQSDKLTGIEIDILNEFVNWAKENKDITVSLSFTPYSDFGKFIKEMSEKETEYIGAGTITITPDRKKAFKFSEPYMRNMSVMVTGQNTEPLDNIAEISQKFEHLTAIVVKNSNHEENLENIKKKYWPKMRVKYVDDPSEIINLLKNSGDYFAYIDVITFWKAVTKVKVPLRLHRATIIDGQKFAFVGSKESKIIDLLNEFFNARLGFTATEKYRKILEKHLGAEILETVELY